MINDRIKERIEHVPGDIGIYYINTATSEGCFAGNCDIFPASGAVMLFPLIEAFRRIDEGTLDKHQKYRLRKSDYINYDAAFGAIGCLHEGIDLTVEDLYQLMYPKRSSTNATDDPYFLTKAVGLCVTPARRLCFLY